jgi:serine/threonine protein kinase
MALTPGTSLGPYEIAAQIGVGGMGEVYRATDTKLKREVAVKVLPTSLASDPDRLARFQREAEVLASLNHSNIAAIYGLEDADGSKALVMERVEGPTLAAIFGDFAETSEADVAPFAPDRFADPLARSSLLKRLTTEGAVTDHLLRMRRVYRSSGVLTVRRRGHRVSCLAGFRLSMLGSPCD